MKKLAAAIATTVATFSPLEALSQEKPVPRPMATETVRQVSPALAHYTDYVLFGDVWGREGLTPRDRSLVTITTLIANGRAGQLPNHLRRALNNGVTPLEISEVLGHLAFYSGWPTAYGAADAVSAILKERGEEAALANLAEQPALTVDAATAERHAVTLGIPASEAVGSFTTQTSETIINDLWLRPGLAPRDRHLVTAAALIANGQPELLPFYINGAMDNGMTAGELSEAVNHIAFYAGWPDVVRAAPAVHRVLVQRASSTSTEVPNVSIQRFAENPMVPQPAQNVVGRPMAGSRFEASPGTGINGGIVNFPAGSRTNWHTHPHGQTIIVTAGEGWVQVDGNAIETMQVGDVVTIPANARHWHGATSVSDMSHVAMARGDENGRNSVWLEPVSEEDYLALEK